MKSGVIVTVDPAQIVFFFSEKKGAVENFYSGL